MTFREMIKARGLTVREAQEKSGISPETFKVLLYGGQTIPQLALQVGRNLHLTREEVKQLGKTLDRAEWKRLNLPVPPPIDGDPLWYEKVDKPQRETASRKPEEARKGIRRIVVDGAAVKRAMDMQGMSALDLQRALWPGTSPKNRSTSMWRLKDNIKGGIGMQPETVRKLAEAIGKTVEEIGTETWIDMRRGKTYQEKEG